MNSQITHMTLTRFVAIGALAALAPMLVSLAAPEQAEAKRRVWTPSLKQRVPVIRPQHLGSQLATWYGPGFYGNRTGCGSTLRPGSWGIAHRTLPCGKLVWLRFKGREVAVPVIDRGPFSGASIDLTARTAKHLRFTRYGAGNVRMTVLRRRMKISRL